MRYASLVAMFAGVGLVALVAFAQSTDDAAPSSDTGLDTDLHNKLLGAWILDSTPEDTAGNKCLKFWGKRHWTISTYSPAGDIISHHGGTYTITDNKYSETVEYAAELTRDWALGKTFNFSIEIDGDVYTQTGIGNEWNETWTRLK